MTPFETTKEAAARLNVSRKKVREITSFSPVEQRAIEALVRLVCPKCGSPMRIEERTLGFDRTTGAPILTVLAKCSRRVWFGDPHDEYVVSPRPPAPPMPPVNRP